LRSAGHNKKVCFIQFIKGSWQYGELESVKMFEDTIDFHVMGNGFTWKSENLEEDRKKAVDAWDFAREMMASGKYSMIVLDEFTYLLNYNILDLESVIDTLMNKPSDLHIAITGRGAPKALIDAADLVTEMRVIKHPYQSGIYGQKGVEF
ncbi:MAG: cob(I)yrinic acid a,c-diamide adenosyltransferase, partial [Deltaproteobacteria bacterium]|nr:cob(I)yrinic acid a,c-diamide adenosyltransferase [Deltaproteobacteria bacterium]